MREKQIENKLASEVKKAGGIALKFVSPSFDGMPDRLVLIPDGHIAFVELKAPGKKPRPLQLARHRLLRSLGFRVYVIDSVEQIGGMLDEVQSIHDSGISWERLEKLGLEYRYCSQYLQGQFSSKEEFIEKLFIAIRQFAKRQETWYRSMEKKGIVIHWLPQESDKQVRFHAAMELLGKV